MPKPIIAAVNCWPMRSCILLIGGASVSTWGAVLYMVAGYGFTADAIARAVASTVLLVFGLAIMPVILIALVSHLGKALPLIALAMLLFTGAALAAGFTTDGPLPDCIPVAGNNYKCPETPEQAQARQKALQQDIAQRVFMAKLRSDMRRTQPALAAQLDILDALQQLHQDNLDAAKKGN